MGYGLSTCVGSRFDLNVLLVGDLAGLSVNLARILRKAGMDAQLYLPEGYSPVGLDWSDSGSPDWVLRWKPGLSSLPQRLETMRQFDLIQPVAMGIEYSWLSGRPTVAYAMGSDLRAVAFESSLAGYLMRTGFRKARGVFVSTPDLMHSLEALGIAGLFLPQALPRISPPKPHASPNGFFNIFCPSRLDWSSPTPKGNDRIFHALKLLPGPIRNRCQLRLVDWGADRLKARDLASNLGLKNVQFLPLMNRNELYRTYAESDLVIDQFRVRSFGLAAIEAMLMGKAVVAGVDEPLYQKCYGVRSPVLAADTARQIAGRIQWAFENPAALRRHGIQARKWLLNYHSDAKIVSIARKSYARILSSA